MKKLTKVFGILFVIGLLFSCADGSSSSSSDNTDNTDNTNNTDSESTITIDGEEYTYDQRLWKAESLLSINISPEKEYNYTYTLSKFPDEYNYYNIYFIQFNTKENYIYNIQLTPKDENTNLNEILEKYKVTKKEILKEIYTNDIEDLQEAEKNAKYVINYFNDINEKTKDELESNYSTFTTNVNYKVESIDLDNATITFNFSNIVLGRFSESSPKKSFKYLSHYINEIEFTKTNENNNFYENSYINSKSKKIENYVLVTNYEIYVKQNYK